MSEQVTESEELAQYVGLPKCQDCGWKLGSEITNNCSCLGSLLEDDAPEKYKKAFDRARELQSEENKMTLKSLTDSSCITVAQLKELIKDWPEENWDGEPTEVWIGDKTGLSNPCRSIFPLNYRVDDGKESADIILDSI